MAAALAAAALAAAALVPAAEANFGEAPAPAPGREVCRDGKPPRYWDVVDDPLYGEPLGITHPRRVGGCSCAYEHIDDLTPERLDTYNRQRRPLVIAGAMEGWPAMKNWRDNAYLTQGPWGKHVFPKPPQGLMTEHSPCKFAGRLKWERIGKERFDEWVKQCGVREAKATKRYLTGKYGTANQGLFPETGGKMTFGDIIGEMFGEGRGKKKLQKKWYGKYFLVSSSSCAWRAGGGGTDARPFPAGADDLPSPPGALGRQHRRAPPHPGSGAPGRAPGLHPGCAREARRLRRPRGEAGGFGKAEQGTS